MSQADPQDDPVLRIILERAREGSRPGDRRDQARVALAVEGGGMGGVVSGGMCVALETLGLIPCFDVIYGSSAGAINASYTAAGQARERAQLYQLAAQHGMIAPRQALRGRPPFRLDEIFTSLFHAYPHALAALNKNPPVRVTAARVDNKELDVLGDFASIPELRTGVWASCAIPLLAGDVVQFRGTSYVDGGLLESLPYRAALREGATHVLVLRSRHAGYRKRPLTGARRRLANHFLRGAPDTIADMLYERPARYNDDAADLQYRRLNGCVTQLAPPADTRQVSQIERRPRRLREGLTLGTAVAHASLADGAPRRVPICPAGVSIR